MQECKNIYTIKPLHVRKTFLDFDFPISKFFFVTALLYFSNLLFAEEGDSATVYQNQNAIIFVSENSIVHGAIYITSYSQVLPPKTFLAKKKISIKSKRNFISAQHQIKKNKEALLYKNIQKQIDRHIECQFDPSSQKEVREKDYQPIASSFNGGNSNPFFIFNLSLLQILIIPANIQRIYTSVSFLQFSRLLDSFLRGPPHLF